tara:strand:+ start:23 stop:952 length:930 start_codon:yes stop_codon:yes gene_type:complete
MADDIDNQLAELEDSAELTPEKGEGGLVDVDGDGSGDHADTMERGPARQAKQRQQLDAEEMARRWQDQRGALSEERAKRRAVERQMIGVQQAMEQQREQFRQFLMQQQARQAEPVDPEVDVITHAKMLEHRLRQMEGANVQAMQQRQAMAQQQAAVQQLTATVEDYESEFRADYPDYDHATDYLLALEQRQLIRAGMPEQQAAKAVENWAMNMANVILSSGRNPAHVAYETAVERGYVPQHVMEQLQYQQQQLQQNTSGRVAQIRAGQQAAQTLSGGGMVTGDSNSLKSIANLKGAAFDKAFDKFMRGD